MRGKGYDTNELLNGCCRMILFSLTEDFIDAGMGPICTLKYDVAEEAPEGACIDLRPEHVKIADEDTQPSDIRSISIPGEFCFKGNEGEEER